MNEKIALTIIVVLSVASVLFLGSGITGYVVADASPSHGIQSDSNNIYIGMILMITLMLFLVTAYSRYFTGEHHRHN